MRSFLLASLASLAALKSVNAHPLSQNSRMLSRRAVDLDSFRMVLNTEYKKSDEVDSDPAVKSLTKRADAKTTAEDLVKATVEGATFRLAPDSYVGKNGIAHFYFKQTANDLDIDNADFNVNIGRDGKIFSFGNSFYKGDIPSAPSKSKRATVEPQEALKFVIKTLGLPISADTPVSKPNDEPDSFSIQETSGTVKEPEAKLVYIQTAEGDLKLVWRVDTDIWSDWLVSYVDAETGDKIHHVLNYAAEASYEVYPWGLNDPTEGERIIIKDPANPDASEFGWHSTGDESFNTTRGNNGIAQSNWDNRQDYLNLPRPVSEDLTFHYPYSTSDSDWKGYSNASITQLFYTSNTYHDLLHILGFDEAAGNFEINNNGAGGVGNDFVILNTQDGSGTNNANFLTPPDGTPGRMRMYIWTTTNPPRDSSFEAGVVIHEYTHGLSNRLTGGPANSGCLNILEAGGMGEGWSDFYATAIRLKPDDTHDTDYPMGAWVNGNAGGIRNFLYSTSLETNPQTYKSVDRLTGVHPIGNVWASILYEVLWNLIDKHGKNDAGVPDFDENGVPTDGKYLALKLVLDGMALQPCNPTFVTARDAIIDADENLTGGSNACELWSGFAKRGLGEGAVYSTTSRTESFDVPDGVC